MGLDITAHSKISPLVLEGVADDNRSDAAYDAGGFVAYLNDAFAGRADDVVDRATYQSEDSFGFRAGSYSGYNEWREQLAKFAGYPLLATERHGQIVYRHDAAAWAADSGPFWELIHFSDCEGVIGSAVSAKLAKDFAEHQAQADALPDDDADGDWFKKRYADWRKAFDMAADGGCVEFH